MQIRTEENDGGYTIEITPLKDIVRLCVYIPSHSDVIGAEGKRKGDMLVFENLREKIRFSVKYKYFTEKWQNRDVHMKGDYVLLCGDRGDEHTRSEIQDRFTLPDRNAVEALREYL